MATLFYRKGLDLKHVVADELARDYHSQFVSQIKDADHQMVSGRLTVHLAREFGFCYGVDRAVDYAYQTRRRFPDRTVYLTGEIIHNPHVNSRLRDAGIKFLSDPDETLNAVTPDDVLRVYEHYIRDRHFVAASNVPVGAAQLALAESGRASVVEEPIITGREAELATTPERNVAKTPSTFDRSVEPPFGPTPSLTVPDIWTGALANRVKVYGIEQTEVPVVRFTIRLRGGLLLDDPSQVGVAHFVAQMMTEGTAGRTPEELEEAIDALGSSISVSAGRESLTVSGSTLRRHYGQTMALVEELLLEPRWDDDEFTRIRRRTINRLRRQSADPNAIAVNTFNRLLYGTDHILSHNVLGTTESVESITIEDLRDYFQRYVSPSVASIHVVGDISKDDAIASMAGLGRAGPVRRIRCLAGRACSGSPDLRRGVSDPPGRHAPYPHAGDSGQSRRDR